MSKWAKNMKKSKSNHQIQWESDLRFFSETSLLPAFSWIVQVLYLIGLL